MSEEDYPAIGICENCGQFTPFYSEEWGMWLCKACLREFAIEEREDVEIPEPEEEE